jgi:NAD(P)-dependent dehydrogenase (short-subunit alcohol dehydrogenase family)
MTDTAPHASTSPSLAGKTALITAGTDGIGLHTACGLAAIGASVIVTGRDPKRGARAATQIGAAAGHDQVSFIQADHATVGANQDLARQLCDSLGGLDLLVNNVGRVFPARQETADGYEATLALCFAGPAALTDGLLPLLTRKPGARVVNMSSSAYKMWHHDPFEDVQSERDYIGIQAHAHAKLLNLIWTFALAGQLRPQQVAVNATNPGPAWTPGTAQLTPQAVPAWKYVWPIVRFFQRRGSPAKAAQSPLWLAASGQAGRLTGTYLEKRKQQRPKVATDPDNQRRVIELAHALIAQAPTAQSPTTHAPPASSDETPIGQRSAEATMTRPHRARAPRIGKVLALNGLSLEVLGEETVNGQISIRGARQLALSATTMTTQLGRRQPGWRQWCERGDALPARGERARTPRGLRRGGRRAGRAATGDERQ